MANRIYKNIELLGEITDAKHLVNKEYVDSLLDSRLMQGVKVAVLEDLNSDYDSSTQTLTQKVGQELVYDGVALSIGDEILYVGGGTTDLTQSGIYEITKLGKASKASEATVSLGGSNTGIITLGDVSVSVSTFETGIGTPSTGAYTFTYSGANSSWQYSGGDVDISTTYGVTLSSVTETPADGDTIVINYTEATTEEKAELVRVERFSKSNQLFSGMLIPIHEGTLNHDSIFQLIDDVKPFVLDTTPLHFEKYAGNADGSVKKYEEIIVGNDSDKTFTVTHGLGTKAVDVTIYDKNTGEKCGFGVKVISDNAIEISSDVVLTITDEFLVTVQG